MKTQTRCRNPKWQKRLAFAPSRQGTAEAFVFGEFFNAVRQYRRLPNEMNICRHTGLKCLKLKTLKSYLRTLLGKMMTKTKISFEICTGSFHYTISIEESIKSPSKRWIVFLARKAVRRAAGFGFQHSSITLLIVDKILFSCHDADMIGRKP
uniref:Uncharacterized protein n=1 Tax=Glossina austeni TaxID=7395 RepID=A0A1A9VBF1_GLOAU